MSAVFAFVVLLPMGEHFHIVTALPGLFFAHAGPPNRVPSVDLDRVMNAADGDDVTVGVRTARDLVWKDAYDAFTCTEGGRCKTSARSYFTGKPLALKWVNDSLKKHLVEQRENILAGDATAVLLPALVGPVISEEALWA